MARAKQEKKREEQGQTDYTWLWVFLLQPQDEFEIIITLSGMDLGSNRLENIIIRYLQGDREVKFELPLNETYFNVE